LLSLQIGAEIAMLAALARNDGPRAAPSSANIARPRAFVARGAQWRLDVALREGGIFLSNGHVWGAQPRPGINRGCNRVGSR